MVDWTTSFVIQNGEFTQHAFWALWLIAFAESSFFPIPPDIPFIMMGAIQPEMALYMAFLLSVGSVLGGAAGYAIGYYGGRPLIYWLVHHRIIGRIFTQDMFEMVEDYYKKYDVWAVLAAAFTPIPYKIFTIGGGMCHIRFWNFMLVSLIGRSGRFFLVGGLLYFFGEQAQIIVKNMDKFLLVMLVLLIAGIVALKFIKPRKRVD